MRISPLERQKFVDEVMSDTLGYGPLDAPLSDSTITEIMCNAYDDIWIEREGLVEQSDLSFADEEQYHQVIQKIVTGVGRRVDEIESDGRRAAPRRLACERDRSAAGACAARCSRSGSSPRRRTPRRTS